MTKDVNVILLDFPNAKEKEVVTLNEDGTYTVFINSRLSYEAQLKAYDHALRHIKDEDFEQSDVQHIEAKAHELTNPKNAEPIPGKKYIEEIKRLQRRRKRLQRQLREEEKRIRFMVEECGIDLFERTQDYKAYGDNF